MRTLKRSELIDELALPTKRSELIDELALSTRRGRGQLTGS